MKTILKAVKAAADETRLRILCLLARGELAVSEIVQVLGQSQPRVSRHLRLLADAGLIRRYQEGSWAFYRLADADPAAPLARTLIALAPDEDAALQRDLERLKALRADQARAAEAYFSAQAARWDDTRALYIDEAEVERATLAAADVDEVGEMIDIGTGTARMLELFAPHIRRGVGIDLNRDMLAAARARLAGGPHGHCQVRLGDMYAIAAPPESYDLAVLHQVLHFAEDPGATIAEAARVLRPGGQLLIADFAPHDQEFLRRDHAHRRLGFADAEVNAWCRSAGLEARVAARLPGDPLTVTIWKALKSGSARRAAA